MALKYDWGFTLLEISQIGGVSGATKVVNIDPPLEWNEISIQVSFEDIGSSNIEIDELTFVNEGYEFIKNVLDNGNVFGEYLFDITLREFAGVNGVGTILFRQVFYLDFSSVTFFDDTEIPKVKIKLKDGRQGNTLLDFLNANTFIDIYDKENNTILNQDFSNMLSRVGVIVEKEDTTLEQIVLFVTLYQLGVQLADAVKDLAKTIADTAAHAAGGISGSVAAFGYGIAIGILQGIYIASIITAMIQLVTRLQTLLFPIPFTRGVLRLGDAMRGIFRQAGFEIVTFSDDIASKIDDYYYLPSNIEELKDSSPTYFPNPSDFGYTYSEFVNMVLNMFEARIFNIDGEIVISNENEDFLFRDSTYELPNILKKPYSLNVGDFNSKEVFQFRTDISDEYTINNFKGTSFEVDNIIKDNKTNIKIKDVDYGVALGNRKNETSILESLFESVVDTMNLILSVILANPINKPILADRIGLLKVSNKSWSLPKVLNLELSSQTYFGDPVYKLPLNHRDNLSAKTLYENNHIKMSFNDGKNRRSEYQQVKVFFDYNAYNKLIKNNYFTIEGSDKRGRVTALEWEIDNDFAILDYYVIEAYNIGVFTQKFTEIE